MINNHERADHLPDTIVWIESYQKKKCTNYLNRETYPLNSDGGCIGFYTQTWNSDKSKYEIEEQDPVAFCSILSLLFSCLRFSFENRIVEYNEYIAEYIKEKVGSSSKISYINKDKIFGNYNEIQRRFANTTKTKQLISCQII